MNQRTPNYKKCVLLRLPFLSPLLYLAPFHRETSGRTPRELRINSEPQKSTFLKIALLKRLTHYLKKFAFFACSLCLLLLNPIRVLIAYKLKNAPQSAFFLHISKKYCTFAAQRLITKKLCLNTHKIAHQ